MRAWCYKTQGLPSEVLQLCSGVADPEATTATPIIVDVHAAALNPDSSVLMRIIPRFLLRGSPRIPEIDFAGAISQIGKVPSSCSFKVGDKVYGHIPPVRHVIGNTGTLAEKVAVSPDWIVAKPCYLTYEEAASLTTAFVSAYKLASNVRSGSKVFVNGGSGGIGLALLQILKNWKDATVATTASTQSWHIVERFRPDNIVNYKEIKDLSGHLQESFEPFDSAIDLVGDRSLLKRSHRFLAKDGVFIAFGGGLSSPTLWRFLSWFIATVTMGFLPSWLGGCGRHFRFVTVSRERDTVEGMHVLEHFHEKDWILPTIDSIYDFEDALEGYKRLATRRADGKVVIRIGKRGQGSASLPSPT